ncbi:MAG: MipA/OmpV family protein [Candidatus Dactylopiibacterium sp.]|nr:MipA/OmpV family protein [Candidatus Dactylopiibacterium sp.]
MNQKRMFSGAARVAMALVAGGVVSQAAFAQASAPAAEADTWQFSLGAGAVSRPKYPGASSQRTQLLPVISATYGRYFIGGAPGSGAPAGLGAYLYRGESLRLGVSLGVGVSKARKESDDDSLRGLGDIDGATRAAVFASHNPTSWLTLSGSVSADISDNKQGVLATFDAQGRYQVFEGFSLVGGPGLTWANREYTQTFFGIDGDQSARSGRAEYRAGSGLNALRFSVGADYAFTKRWSVGGRAVFSRLQNDAADSPITAERMQNTYFLFTAYRF